MLTRGNRLFFHLYMNNIFFEIDLFDSFRLFSLTDDDKRSSQKFTSSFSQSIDSISCRFQSMSTSIRWSHQISNRRSNWNSSISFTSQSTFISSAVKRVLVLCCLGCIEIHSKMSTNENDHRRFRIGHENALFRRMIHSIFAQKNCHFLANYWFSSIEWRFAV